MHPKEHPNTKRFVIERTALTKHVKEHFSDLPELARKWQRGAGQGTPGGKGDAAQALGNIESKLHSLEHLRKEGKLVDPSHRLSGAIHGIPDALIEFVPHPVDSFNLRITEILKKK